MCYETSHLNGTKIACIVIFSFAFVVIICVILFFTVFRRKHNKHDDDSLMYSGILSETPE